jgi:diacylglycerol kinase family enzyme
MSDARTVLISANPRSGARSGLEVTRALQAELERASFQVELLTDIDAFTDRAKELHAARSLRTVVSAGGDGTASLILSKIPSTIPVTLFPLGSENLLAKYFARDCELSQTVQAIETMRTVPLDLFRANGQLTLLVTSVGYDADVVRRVHENRRSHITRWAYRAAILKSLASYTWPLLEVEVKEQDGSWGRVGECHWLFAFNVPRYAAGIAIINDTPIDDGLIEVGMFEGGGLFQGMWNYGMVARGVHQQSKQWRQLRVSGVRVRQADLHRDKRTEKDNSKSPVVGYQIDGDWGGSLPLEIEFTGSKAQIVIDP